jgi:hypothetical protein
MTLSYNGTNVTAATFNGTVLTSIACNGNVVWSGRVTIAIVLTADTLNYDLINQVGSTYIAGKSDITVTVNSGVVIGSNSASNPAMRIRDFVTGDTVTLVNNGSIAGAGGAGGSAAGGGGGGGAGRIPGAGGLSSSTVLMNSIYLTGEPGQLLTGGYFAEGDSTLKWRFQGNTSQGGVGGNGGPALIVSSNTTIQNNGTIGGGGGGGGSGGFYAEQNPDDGNWWMLNAYPGGYGGDLGNDGETGSGYDYAELGDCTGGVGGSAGAAVTGNSYLNWGTYGTIRGAVL